MRACLVVSARDPDERITPAVLAAARSAIGEAVPVPADRWRTAEWIAPGGGTALLAWSDEPSGEPFPEPILTSGDRALTYCGYLGGKGDADLLLGLDTLGGDLDGLGGCYSVFRAGPDGFEAATSITRACPVYHAGRAACGSPRPARCSPTWRRERRRPAWPARRPPTT